MEDYFLLCCSFNIWCATNSYLLHFYLQWLRVNTLTSLSTPQRLFVEPANQIRKQEILLLPSWPHTYYFLFKAKGFLTLYSQDLNLRYWQEWFRLLI